MVVVMVVMPLTPLATAAVSARQAGPAAADGTAANGTTANGTTANGTTANGTAANGTTANRNAANRMAANGTTANGTTANGTAADGTTANGTTANGTAANGTTANGTTANGTTANGTTANGTAANGTTANGTTANGTTANGTAANGTTANGTAANGTTANGTSTNGTSAALRVTVTGITKSSVSLAFSGPDTGGYTYTVELVPVPGWPEPGTGTGTEPSPVVSLASAWTGGSLTARWQPEPTDPNARHYLYEAWAWRGPGLSGSPAGIDEIPDADARCRSSSTSSTSSSSSSSSSSSASCTNATEVTFAGLEPATEYRGSIRAVVQGKAGDCVTFAGVTAPAAVRGFSVSLTTPVTDSSVPLEWLPASAGPGLVARYRITVASSSSSSSSFNSTSSPRVLLVEGTRHVLHSLRPATHYSLLLAACNGRAGGGDARCGADVGLDVTTKEQVNPAVIAGGVLGVTLPLAVIGTLGFLYLKHKHRGRRDNKPTVIANRALPLKKQRRIRNPVPVSGFRQHFEALHRDSDCGFAEEFEELQGVGKSESFKVASLPANQPKNRYSNILPYDKSRVHLQLLDHDPHSDYINANYIPGMLSERDFIAAQGPMSSLLNDFWRLVWEQQVQNIVMLTQCVEGGRNKCDQYWPSAGVPCLHGHVMVELRGEERLADWTVRTLLVSNQQQQNTTDQEAECERSVRHFHFTAWPDHGAPAGTASIVAFARLVRANARLSARSTPTLVHCSAGVGRTGTFIALDTALQQLDSNSDVDIYGCTHTMRSNRMLMVQTEAQYVFVHQCVSDLLPAAPGDGFDPTAGVYENVHAAGAAGAAGAGAAGAAAGGGRS
uniref:protein-tyrosine-phosphatase n=1 Tax=Petromyzon marinus TaxID=7757 RepID=A0AAJ7UIJ6_PETMA|nr:receptor-type tyrosine-protein phosphatase H-like [Petromyzon marinus]